MIKFENVTKQFKDTKVLANTTLEIEEGQLVVLIGASGCGKTTTLKMINRLIKPTTGKIYIKNEDISVANVIELRRNIGYVIQQTGLFPHMTIKENIELIPRVQKQNLEKITQKTYELMDMVGLESETFLQRYPTELSGGQQQRVGVARAFATDPDIILMDEPFSALDPITRSGLQDELILLHSKFCKTIVFVTHDMDEAIKIADKICIMDKGKIVQFDTPENILKNPANDFVSEFVGKNRIWTSPDLIKAQDIMIENPVTCSEAYTVFKCMEKMKSHKVDSLMVIDTKTKGLKGIVSAQELRLIQDQSQELRLIQDQSQELRLIQDQSQGIKEIMKREYLSIQCEESMIDVLTMVNENNVSSIPVIDQDKILCGLITKSSLVTTLSQQYIEEAE